MGEMRVLCEAGDIRVEWDKDDPESVAKAKAEWDRLRKDGYEFYEVIDAKGKRLKGWSADRGKVIAAPGIQKPIDRVVGPRPKAMAGQPNDRGLGMLR